MTVEPEVLVTVDETQVIVTVTDNTPVITITDPATPDIVIIDAGAVEATTADIINEVTVLLNGGRPNQRITSADLADLLSVLYQTTTLDNISPELAALLNALGIDLTTLSGSVTDVSNGITLLAADLDSYNNYLYTMFSQTADAINLIAVDVDSIGGTVTFHEGSFHVSSAAIDTIVSTTSSLGGRLTTAESTISVHSDSIALSTSLISDLSFDLSITSSTVDSQDLWLQALEDQAIIKYSLIDLNAEAITAQVVSIDGIAGRISYAEDELTAQSATLTVHQENITGTAYVLNTTRTMLNNSWNVEVTKDSLGNHVAAGFGIKLYEDWGGNDVVYTLGDNVWYAGTSWVAILSHTSTSTDYPQVDSIYWAEVPGGVATEFRVQADRFIIQDTSGTGASPFSIVDGVVNITGRIAIDATLGDADLALADALASINAVDDILIDLGLITDDNVLTVDEKDYVINLLDVINTESVDIIAQATQYGCTVEKTAYTDAINALTTYLATLTVPVAWDSKLSHTNMNGATLHSKFGDVAKTRQWVLNAISSATYGATAAEAAEIAQIAGILVEVNNIASDNILNIREKDSIINLVSVINTDRTGIEAQATTYGCTTEKTNYTNAVDDLTAHLATLTSPVLWNNKTNYTDIDGALFYSKFTAVATTRQLVLSAISNAVSTAANTYADAAEDAAVFTANAYTDGEITASEAALILAYEAYADATQTAAETTAAAYADGIVTTAEADAIAAANAYSDAAEYAATVTAAAYADGIVSTEEARAIADATAKANAAQTAANSYTQGWSAYGAQTNPTSYKFGPAAFALDAAVPSSTAGLHLGNNILGYHNGSSWLTYMDSSGRFYLGGTSGALVWNGSTLAINGSGTFTGDVSTTGYIKASGVSLVTTGYSAAVQGITTASTSLGGYFSSSALGYWGVDARGYNGLVATSLNSGGKAVDAIAYNSTAKALDASSGICGLGGIWTDLNPSSTTSTRTVGTAANKWLSMNAGSYWIGATQVADSHNDLAVIDAMTVLLDEKGKPVKSKHGLQVANIKTIDDAFTNRTTLISDLKIAHKEELINKIAQHNYAIETNTVNGYLLSDKELSDMEYDIDILTNSINGGTVEYHDVILNKKILKLSENYQITHDELEKMECTEMGAMVALAQGGVRQMNTELTQIVNDLTLLNDNQNIIIADLVKRIEHLESK
jgi:hypothetical protein